MSERVIAKFRYRHASADKEDIFKNLAIYYCIVSHEEKNDVSFLIKKFKKEMIGKGNILIDLINLFKRGYVDYIKNYFDDEDYYTCKLQTFKEYINDFIHGTEQGIYDELDAFIEEYVFEE